MKASASVVLGLALALCAACSGEKETTSSSAPGTSKLDESCAATSDCMSGLVCVRNICIQSQPPTEAGTAIVSRGKRGESCLSRADCETGLACINNMCGLADYGLTVTGKKCVQFQCSTPIDCCPKPSSMCQDYATYCEGGISTYCDLYLTSCLCDGSKYTCEQNKCIQACTGDGGISSVCPYTTPYCTSGRCVQCTKDPDCTSSYGTGYVCANSTCQRKCTEDYECPAFSKCQSSACVAVGCSTNRECILARSDPMYVCDTATKACIVPCQTDAECDRGSAVGVAVCVSGQCKDIGCETADDCRAMNPGTGTRWACEAVTTP